AAAGVLERADQLFLLGIHADHGQAPRQIPAPYPGQVAELPVPVGVARPRQALAVGPQGEALLLEQPGHGPMRTIRIGMTTAEVDAILGQSPAVIAPWGFRPGERRVWYSRRGNAAVDFDAQGTVEGLALFVPR